jgi:hypothetical protein
MVSQKKTLSSLSQNPNTIKERNRRNSKHGFDAQLEKRKRANKEQIRLAKNKAMAGASFQEKSKSEQAEALENAARICEQEM